MQWEHHTQIPRAQELSRVARVGADGLQGRVRAGQGPFGAS